MGLKRRFAEMDTDDIFNIEDSMPEHNPRKIKTICKQINHNFMPNLKSNIEIPY